MDSHTSAICQELDGKVFDMKDYQPGSTAPPFHVRCRSCTAPYFDDEFTATEMRAAGDGDGKTYYVPASMKYGEWAAEYVQDATFVYHNDILDMDQFEKYKSVLGKLAPNSIDKFQNIKYNDGDKWNTLKYQYRTVNRYDVDGDVEITKILELDNVAWYTKQKGFDYSSLTGQNKKNIKNQRKNGNAASMELDGTIYFAYSKISTPGTIEYDTYIGKPKLVGEKVEKRFSVLNLDDGIPRERDTEAKFLEFVADIKSPDDKFTVTILSEKHICESCRGVVEQFKAMFPKATVNIISGKSGYNRSTPGLKTWVHRKKVL